MEFYRNEIDLTTISQFNDRDNFNWESSKDDAWLRLFRVLCWVHFFGILDWFKNYFCVEITLECDTDANDTLGASD